MDKRGLFYFKLTKNNKVMTKKVLIFLVVSMLGISATSCIPEREVRVVKIISTKALAEIRTDLPYQIGDSVLLTQDYRDRWELASPIFELEDDDSYGKYLWGEDTVRYSKTYRVAVVIK
jgi:hypothetical protein